MNILILYVSSCLSSDKKTKSILPKNRCSVNCSQFLVGFSHVIFYPSKISINDLRKVLSRFNFLPKTILMFKIRALLLQISDRFHRWKKKKNKKKAVGELRFDVLFMMLVTVEFRAVKFRRTYELWLNWFFGILFDVCLPQPVIIKTCITDIANIGTM